MSFTRDPVTGALWFECDPEHFRPTHPAPSSSASHSASSTLDLQCQSWAAGYGHALDRAVSIFTLRIIAQGRLSELLLSTNDTLQIDAFMRDLNFAHDAALSAPHLPPTSRLLLQSYADGINYYMATYPRPFEFLLVGLEPEPWTVADTVLILKLMTYIPLAEVQRDAEAFIFQSLKVPLPPFHSPRLLLTLLLPSTA